MNELFQHSPTTSFDYVVKRQRRKTIALHIMPDASVEVRVPEWVPKREWIRFVEARADWVITQQRAALEKLTLQPKFSHGEHHRYLGQAYPLNVTVASKSSVVFSEGVLHVCVRDPNNPDTTAKALAQWYRSQAKLLFSERIDSCFSLFPLKFQEQYARPLLTLRNMRRRWGSCSHKGEVTLNIQLIKMPIQCIDYVVIHELCHLAVFNHSPDFYALMTQVIPDWKMRKTLLEAQA